MTSPRLTAAEIDELRALCEKATPGPWQLDTGPGGSVSAGKHQVSLACGSAAMHDERGTTSDVQAANAAFSAAARTALPRLLAEREEIEKEIKEARALLRAALELEGGIRPHVVVEMVSYLARHAEEEGGAR